jgi:transcriptional regulator with XRE-family HTH domain
VEYALRSVLLSRKMSIATIFYCVLMDTHENYSLCIVPHALKCTQMHKKEPNQCVVWLRKELGFTQQQLAMLIGSKQPTIQSIETGRLTLSEHFAFALERKTGISHQWLLRNDPNAPAVTPAGKPWSNERQHDFPLGQLNEMDHFFNRVQLMQTYVLFRGILWELGDKGAQATGFHTKLHKASLDLLATITDKKVRDRVYSEAMKLQFRVGPEAKLQYEEKLKLVAQDVKELLRIGRGYVKELDEKLSEHLGIDGVAARSQFEKTGVWPLEPIDSSGPKSA